MAYDPKDKFSQDAAATSYRKADGSWHMFEAPPNLCQICARYDNQTGECPAFPDGIPLTILSNKFDHREPHLLQVGDMQFWLKEGYDQPLDLWVEEYT